MTLGLERIHRIIDGREPSGFIAALGPVLTHAGIGEVALEFTVPAISNASTSPSRAGLACAIADIAATCAATTTFDSENAAVTLALWVHFLRPVTADVLRARAVVDDQNEVAVLADGHIEQPDGTVVARLGARCLGLPALASSSEPDSTANLLADVVNLPIDLQFEQQRTVGRLTCTSGMANARQVVHGGAIMAVAEVVARSLLTDRHSWTLADVEACFVRGLPADGGHVECAAQVRHAGRTSTTVTWSIKNAAGKTAVYGSMSWLRLAPTTSTALS